MRSALLAAVFGALLPLSAHAAPISATIDVSTGGTAIAPVAVVSGSPVTAAPGDTVTFTFRINPDAFGATAYLFAFTGHGGVTLVGPAAPPAAPPGITDQLPGGLASSSPDGVIFSFNNALATDLPSGFHVVGTFTVDVGAGAGLDAGLTLTGNSTLSTLDFLDAVMGPRELITIVPEPGTALLIGFGALGMALARRRSA